MADVAMLIDDQDRSEQLAEILKALGHPVRLRLVASLIDEEATVNALCEKLDVRQSLVSQHLSILRMLGLVSVVRSGGSATYSIKEEGLRDLLKCLTGCRRGVGS